MIYILIGLIILAIAGFVATMVFRKLYRKCKSDLDEKCLQLTQLQEEYSKLAKAYKIKKENKEKADEKISNLHSGDSVANAINILRK